MMDDYSKSSSVTPSAESMQPLVAPANSPIAVSDSTVLSSANTSTQHQSYRRYTQRLTRAVAVSILLFLAIVSGLTWYFAQRANNNALQITNSDLGDVRDTNPISANPIDSSVVIRRQLVVEESVNIYKGLEVGGTLTVGGELITAGSLEVEGALVAGTLAGDGSNIFNLNGSNITSGVISTTVLPSSLAYLANTQTFSGTNTFSGSTFFDSTVAAAGVITQNGNIVCDSSNNCGFGLAGGVEDINGETGSLTVQGTPNQIAISESNGTFTFSASQDINTGATPTFTGLVLSGLDCSSDLNGGALTTNASGQLLCSDDDGGVGGAVSTPGGTSGAIPVFTGATSIADSILTQSGTVVTADGTLNATSELQTNSIARITSTGALQNVTADAAIITAGTISDARLSANVSLLGASIGLAELEVDSVNSSKLVDGSVANIDLTNSTLIVTAGGGLINGGSVALGDATTLDIGAGDGITINADDVAVDATVCRTSGNCLGGAGGANTALSNLSSVAINTSLLTGAATIDLGSSTNAFRDLYLGGTATNNFRITGTATTAQTITIPNASGTLAVSGSGNIALSATGDITTVDNPSFSSSVTSPQLNSIGPLDITPGGALTVGATTQTLTLQGSTTNISATAGANTTTLQFQAPTASATYRLLTAAAGTYDICTSVGNCLGGGGGGANTALSNLSSVAINTILLPGVSDSIDLGSAGLQFRTGYFASSLLTPLLDTAAAGTLAIGTTNATAINLNQDTVLAANKSLTVTGGTTANRPASPTEGMIFYDTDTDQLLIYANGKWQADRSTATKIVAASNSQNKEKADYVADGTADQTEINAAISALPAGGGIVYLLEGTYTISGAILPTSNSTLAGSGPATVLLSVADGGVDNSFNIIQNSNTAGGNNNITLKNFKIDGNKTAVTASTRQSIYMENVGSGVGASAVNGFTIDGLVIQNSRSNDIDVLTSFNSRIANSQLTAATGTAVNMSGSDRVTIADNYIHGTAVSSIQISDGDNNMIRGNHIEGTIGPADSGINISTGSNSNTIDNNVVKNNNGYGIVLGGAIGASGNVISNNHIEGNTEAGIRIGFVFRNLVTGNNLINNDTFVSGTTASIEVSGNSDDHQITGNRIHDSSDGSFAITIFSSSSDRIYLADNHFTSTAGISDAGTGTIYGGQLTGSNDYVLQGMTDVGIGTLTPDAKLEVLQSSTATTAGTLQGYELTVTDTGIVTTGTDTTYGQKLTVTRTGATGGTINTTGLDLTVTGDTGGTSTVTGLNVNVSGADTNYAAIFQGGNVGIGEASPSELLYISRNTSAKARAVIQNTNASGTVTASFEARNGTTASDGLAVGVTGTAFIDFGAIVQDAGFITAEGNLAGGLSIGTIASAPIRFFTGASADERVRIDSVGNLGIGTNNPGSVLHTVATGAKTATYTGNLLTNTATSSTASINKYGLEIQSTGTWNGTSANNVGLYVSSVTGGTNNYDAIFNGGGNVGIGTTTPADKLTVVGSDTTGLSIIGEGSRVLQLIGNDETHSVLGAPAGRIIGPVARSLTVEIQGNGASDRFAVITDPSNEFTPDTEVLTVLNSGNVGIGNTNPFALLTVGSSSQFSVTSAGLTSLTNQLDINGTYALIQANVANNDLTLRTIAGTGDLVFATNNTEKVRILDGGNVGIGTAIPSRLLEISKNQSASTGIKIANTTNNAAAEASIHLQSNAGSFFVGQSSSSEPTFAGNAYLSAENSIHILAGFTETLRVTSSGVAVGNGINPLAKLHIVTQNAGAIGQIIQGASGQATDLFQAQNVASTVLFRISAAGVIGSPDSTTANTSDVVIRSGNATVGTNLSSGDVYINTGSVTGTGTKGDVILQDTGGNVGIGMTPSSKLDVYHNTGTSDVDVFRLLSDVGGASNVKFRVDSDGDIFTDGSVSIGTPADVAEQYGNSDGAEPGNVVVFVGATKVAKSSAQAQKGLAGVVSTEPGLTLSSSTPGVPVALSGRVPVKVTTANGPIEIGDYLTSGPDGTAQRATQAGPTIGTALESIATNGTIEVFVHLGYYYPSGLETTQAQAGSPQAAGDGSFESLNVSGSATIAELKVTGLATVGSLRVTGTAEFGADIRLAGVGNKRNAITKTFIASRAIAPGNVVIADPERDGYVTTTSLRADRKVIGIAASAATAAGDEIEVAVGGTLQVKVDNIGINSGDLLISSDATGRATVAPEDVKVGTVLGKATSKKDAQGLVWILVTLQ